MSGAIRKIAATSAVALVAGLAVTGAGGTATAAAGGFCEGMSAPQNNDVANLAPVVGNDTAQVVAGTTVVIKVLANDSDPDGDKLYVENASTPKKGQVCVAKNGTVEYYAPGSRWNYTDTFTYGVTDGDRYRTGTVTVSVEGVKPVRPVLKQKLVLKHGKVKQRARVSFTNTNKYRVVLLAGNPKKDRPSVQRVLYPNRTFVFGTKVKRLAYLAILAPKGKEFSFINFGFLNTRNGKIQGQYLGDLNDDEEFRTAPGTRTRQDFWTEAFGR